MNFRKLKAAYANYKGVSTGWDALFMVALAVVLLIFSETGNLDVLWKLPFITIYVSYAIGRFVGEFTHRRNMKENRNTNSSATQSL